MGSLFDRLGLDEKASTLSPNAWIALFLLAFAVMAPGFFNLPTMDRDEARYSQASRQMMETGDYVDIKFQEQNRHVKPAGIYWMQVVTTAPFGGKEAPQWAHRLPSLIGSIAAVLMTAWLGARLGGARLGFIAGLIMAMGLLLSVEARTAKTDAMLLAATLLGQLALFRLFHLEEQDGRKFIGWPLVFWLAQGLGLMVKGPIITIVSVSTILVLCLWRKDWSILKRLQIFKGLVVMLAVVMPWVITITVQTNGGFLEKSVGHALLGKVAKGDDSHGGTPGYHTLALLLTFWPGFFLLVLGSVYAWGKRSEPAIQFLIAWALPTWIIYELVATKLPHYVLPVFPAICLLAALGLKDAQNLLAKKGVKIAHFVAVALFLIVCALLAYVPYYLVVEMGADAPSPYAPFAVIAAILVAVAGLWLAIRPSFERVVPVFLSAIIFYTAMYGLTLPTFDQFWLSRSLKQEAMKLKGCENIAFASMGYREPSVVFHFGTDTLLAEGEDAAEHLQANKECGLIAVSQKDKADFLKYVAERELSLTEFSKVEGYNYVKGDELTMTLYAAGETKLGY